MNLREWLNRNLIDAPFDWLNENPDLVNVIVSAAVVFILIILVLKGPQ
jgi:hypothetical protein